MESESKALSKEWTNDLRLDCHFVLMNWLSVEVQSPHHLLEDFLLFPMIWYKRHESFTVSIYIPDDWLFSIDTIKNCQI